MYQSLTAWTAAGAALFICGLAILKGGWAERRAGIAILIAWFASPFMQVADVFNPEWAILVIDAAVSVVFGWLLWRSKRIWLVVAAALQLLTVAAHVAMLIDLRITMNTYLMGLALWGVAVLVALLAGTLLHMRVVKRSESDGH